MKKIKFNKSLFIYSLFVAFGFIFIYSIASAFIGPPAGVVPTTNPSSVISISRGGTGLAGPGVSGNVLTSNGTAWVSSTPAATGVGGGGTVDKIPKFTASGTIGNSQIFDNGTNIGIGTASPGSTLDVKGILRLSGSTSGFVGFAPPAVAGSTVYSLPSADGTNGQFLKTNGAGVLSFGTAGTAGDTVVTVAANDTPASLKAAADYVADGTADQSEINSALGAADVVYLMQGTYSVNGSISVTSNKALIGSGRNNTVIKLANSSQGTGISLIVNSDTVSGNAKIRLANFKMDENTLNNTNFSVKTVGIEFIKVNDSVLEDLYIYDFSAGANASSGGIRLTTSVRNVVTNSIFEKNHYGGVLNFSGSTENVVSNNVFLTSYGSGVSLGSSSDRNTIVGNTFTDGSLFAVSIFGSNENTVVGNSSKGHYSGAISVWGGNYNIISNNVSKGDATGQEESGAIQIRGDLTPTYSKRNTVIGNTVIDSRESGIGLWLNAQENIVKGNYIRGSRWHGIALDNGSSHNEVVGNYSIENSQELNNTYDNINITANSDYNNVQTNTARQGALASKPRYGLRINSGDSDANLVTNNDLYSSGVTDNLSDAGTGTVTAAGNRPQVAAGGGVPAGAVSFFNLASCPTGWTGLAAAQGRFILGLPASGTLAGTAGAAAFANLANPFNIPVSHNHTISSAMNGTLNSSGAWPSGDAISFGSISTSSTGGGTHTPPYIQLLVCQKS